MKLALFPVLRVNGMLVVRLTDLAKMLNYSDTYLLRIIKKLIAVGIPIAFKWRKNWYVLIPEKPVKEKINSNKPLGKNDPPNEKPDVTVNFPNGNTNSFNWSDVVEKIPPVFKKFILSSTFNRTVVGGKLFISQGVLDSSRLTSKNLTSFTPQILGSFPSIVNFKYGYYIEYKDGYVSTFNPGTGGTLKSTNLPAAFFECARALDAAEQDRNGSNPGLLPRRNSVTTVSFDTGTVSVAAALPITAETSIGGTINVVAQDYLGGSFAAFDGGGGDATSTTIMRALLEIANLLHNAEKAVTPADSQPDNIQITHDLESGIANISANIPFTSAVNPDGSVVVVAIDYL
jgi:hypothetical protein